MSKIISTAPCAGAVSGDLAPTKPGSGAGEATSDAGMFAGIFMMLNTESVAQTEAGQFGMEQGAKEEQGVQEDMSGERSPEETAALVSAMIQPSANKKVGGGNASADPAVPACSDCRRFKSQARHQQTANFWHCWRGKNSRSYPVNQTRQSWI